MNIIFVTLLSVLCAVAQANNPAVACPQTGCPIPDCVCSTTNPPANITDMTEYPQIVMLSFDDAVETQLYYPFYQPLFNLTNHDGCNIGLTFFLSHDYTDYTLVNDLWSRGYEIASHSISHQTPTDYWKNLDHDGWINEMYGLKQIASYLGNLNIDDIVGTRAPFLQGGGDVMMQAYADIGGFEYDSSMPSLLYTEPPMFPYTFDYKSIQDCEITPCPSDSYPGFWEVPLVDFNASSPCSMLDACTGITGENETYDFLLSNFNKHYKTNKAPIGLFTHASWFLSDPTHYPGYMDFVKYVLTLPDVYIVTAKKALEWMKTPTKIVDLANFTPWACTKPSSVCKPVYNCFYNQTTPGGQRYMNSCVYCPANYPWVGDPYGNNTTPAK